MVGFGFGTGVIELCSGDSSCGRKPAGSGDCWRRSCPAAAGPRCLDGGGSFRRSETARTESGPWYFRTRSTHWRWRNVARPISGTGAIQRTIGSGSASSVAIGCGCFRGRGPAAARSRISQRFSGTLLAMGSKPGAFWTDRNTYTSGGWGAAAWVALLAPLPSQPPGVDLDSWKDWRGSCWCGRCRCCCWSCCCCC